jgi:hypothetical protein
MQNKKILAFLFVVVLLSGCSLRKSDNSTDVSVVNVPKAPINVVDDLGRVSVSEEPITPITMEEYQEQVSRAWQVYRSTGASIDFSVVDGSTGAELPAITALAEALVSLTVPTAEFLDLHLHMVIAITQRETVVRRVVSGANADDLMEARELAQQKLAEARSAQSWFADLVK